MPFDESYVSDFILQMAPRWTAIGIKLQLQDEVDVRRYRPESNESKCTEIISLAIQQEKLTSWQQLLEVLESTAVNRPNVARRIREKYTGPATSTNGADSRSSLNGEDETAHLL